MDVSFKYEIGEDVHLIEIDRPAKVDGMRVGFNGVLYSVVYWDDGKRYSIWVYDWEIK